MDTEVKGNIRAFDVWKRNGMAGLVRYRCFEDITTGRFCVQSADFYKSPVTIDRVSQLEMQFIELLLEESPFLRSGSFDTVEEAIAEHDKSFE
jgi:hypothetical protein